MNAENVTDKHVNVTEKIDKFLWKYPESTPKDVCRCLGLAYRKDVSHKKGYGHMVATRKNLLKKFMTSEIKGHLPKPLVSSHRVEWEIERDVPLALVLKVKLVAEKLKPRLEDHKPVGFWYVIPNRNKQLEYHDDFVSIRLFQGTGTCRILPVGEMDFKDLGDRVWEAFLKGGLSTIECDSLLLHLEVSAMHKTFKVPITIQRTFNIDHYKDTLGLEIGGDNSHPGHVETKEGWPTWIKPFLKSAYDQTKASEKQTEVITQLTEQMRLHLSVLSSINENFKLTTEATRELKEAAANLAKSVNPRIRHGAARSIQQKPYKPIEDSNSRFADYEN